MPLQPAQDVLHAARRRRAGCRGLLRDGGARPFLPRPTVEHDGDRFVLDDDRPDSIGKVRPWYGVAPNLVRAYAWIMSLGADGLREVAETAVLNNNYLMAKVLEIRGVSAPYAAGRRRIEQVRYSWEQLTRGDRLTTDEPGSAGRRLRDPLLDQPPPVRRPRADDAGADRVVLAGRPRRVCRDPRSVADEAYSDPEWVRTAPHASTIHRIDQAALDDPAAWAVTWRAYLRKHPGSGADPAV